jgi:hypothetical protein
MLITKAVASAALSLVVNDIPLHAYLLHGNARGCEMAVFTAAQWRAAGAVVIEQRFGAWCVVGKVSEGFWHAEQWEAEGPRGKPSRGWQVRIPLSDRETAARTSYRIGKPWALDVFDPELNARIRYRQSVSGLEFHHQKSMLLSKGSSLVMTRPHPDGGSFSVVIDRGGRE